MSENARSLTIFKHFVLWCSKLHFLWAHIILYCSVCVQFADQMSQWVLTVGTKVLHLEVQGFFFFSLHLGTLGSGGYALCDDTSLSCPFEFFFCFHHFHTNSANWFVCVDGLILLILFEAKVFSLQGCSIWLCNHFVSTTVLALLSTRLTCCTVCVCVC